jgi:UDPglucose 6-dehydrogenase
VRALQNSAQEVGRPLGVLAAVERANEAQKRVLGDKIRARFGATLAGRRIALWGLAFKPNTDDMREAPSRVVIEDLLASGARVRAYDPVARAEARRIYSDEPRVEIVDSALECVDGCDALAIVTEWQEFRSPDFAELARRLRAVAIFDGRNLYDPAAVRAHGIEYFPIGRRT